MNQHAAQKTPVNRLPNKIYVSAFSTRGVKEINQDAYAYHISSNELSPSHVFVIADGVSSSTVSQVASDFATSEFVKLFNIAPEQWSIKTRAEAIIKELNARLYTRTQRSAFCYTPEKGYVCTLSVAILTGNRLDVFHVGDCQVQLVSDNATSPVLLTHPHRHVSDSEPSQTYLSNALGVKANIDIDHTSHTLSASSTIAISTDGVHEFVSLPGILNKINGAEILSENQSALLVHEAFNQGSDDNLTLLLIKYQIGNESGSNDSEPHVHLCKPAFKELETGDKIDGITLERQLYSSARSHVFIASLQAHKGTHEQHPVVVKTPSTDFSQSPEMLNVFLIESWFARRLNSTHVVKSPTHLNLGLKHRPTAFYSISDYVKGQTLAQWSFDNPTPSLEQIRDIIEQVGKGLQAMHRQGILHRDIRPENIMISEQGHCTIIDLGSAALADAPSLYSSAPIPGAALFAAPEYFLGNIGTERSDLFSLAVLTYYLLCGRYPYHSKLAHCRTFAEQKKLKYETALDPKRPIPTWVDSALKRALHVNPDKRYSTLSEFLYSLRYPNPTQHTAYEPLVKRHPLFVYKVLILALIFSNLVTLILFN